MLELIDIRHKLSLLNVFPIIALALLLGYAFNRYAHLESEVESLYANRVVPLIQIKKYQITGQFRLSTYFISIVQGWYPKTKASV